MSFNNYVHIDRILEKLGEVHIPGTYWNLGEIKTWIYEALTSISTKDGNVYTKTTLDIVDNKVKIPVEVEFLDKVVYDEYIVHEVGANEVMTKNKYFVNFGYIYLHNELVGSLDLYYYTTPLSSDGTPLIPDNPYYIKGVLAYLRHKISDRAFYEKKILRQQRDMLEQEWLFYIKATQANNKSKFFKDPNRFRRKFKRFY